MKSLRYLFVLLVTLTISATAQNKKATNTLLWEVSGKGLSKSSYIFGTYHFAGKNFTDSMTVLNDKLKNADAVVGELVMDSTMATKLAPFMLMKNNFLDKLLSATEYKLVDDYFKKVTGYDLKMFNSMKPMAVQITILGATAPSTFSKENPAIDEYFQTYAKGNGKLVYGLETIEDQGEILFGTTLERQKEQLVKSIKEEAKNKKTAEDLYKYYTLQDLAKMESLFKEDDSTTQEEMDKMLKNRNDKWMEKLPAMMQKETLFIAVGALHLVGKDGLIKGLRARGYSVKPVSTN
ncbi:MAG: TraB/GumN family protein [Flavobacteriales bacterium]|nr:MAG: TraB/GumN family protein [Flavobacteriales bacterium]